MTYAEALLWKQHAAKLVADAKAKSAKIPCDPLFESNPRLSSLVSEIDSIKKRHGLLIERALIFAINKLRHWQAAKESIQVTGGNAHLDCLAFNATTRKLYVFECKRGHGTFDADKKRAIDQRLGNITASIGAHVSSKGWSPSSTEVFILSFYGAKWKSKYPIYDKHNVATLFEPCIGRFVTDYMEHLEAATARAYSSELREAVMVSPARSIFDEVDEAREPPQPDVLFTEDGASFVARQRDK
ncbi:hypothetical protein [Pararhodobacter sp. SW119]|uniref:hypothetical protein n=1 Tax=Pararhodobacter sp. SW119 TaxID=2780075 RepID=UPI001ADFDF3D|nr:hypothetical protein [Pararhodobacter sp. SW119]